MGQLRTLAVRSAGATIMSAGLGLAVQIVATMILARLLAPLDFGLVTMVTTFSLLFVNFGLNGFTEAVLQSERMNHPLASNLFWINVCAGLILTACFAACGSLLAWFYHDPPVRSLTVALSLTILITSASVLHFALLKRAMRFSVTSAIEVISAAAAFVIAIFLARAGLGYWALVAAALANPFFQAIGAWSTCRWIPGLPKRVPGTGPAVRFALNVYGRFGVNYGARNFDNLLVGWRFNAQALGFYKKAYDLFALSAGQLVAPLANVAVSALSRLRREPEQYRKYFLGAVGVMAFIGMGLGADLTLVGKDVIRVLLGPGWDTAGQIFTFFGPGIGIMFLYYTHGWLHLSGGRPDRWLRWGILEFVFTGTLFVLALPWGPVGVAAAWTISFWTLTIPAFSYAGKPMQIGARPVIAVVWRYVVASISASLACVALLQQLPDFAPPGSLGAAVRIVTNTVLFATVYLAAVVLLHRSFGPLHEVAGLVREMLPWGKVKHAIATGAGTEVAVEESLSATN